MAKPAKQDAESREQYPWAKSLDVRETTFVLDYLQNLNGHKAALRAGFAAAGARVAAVVVLARSHVREAIAKAMAEEFGVTKGRMAEDLAALAFVGPTDKLAVAWGMKVGDKLNAHEKLGKLLGLQRDRNEVAAGGNVYFIIEGPESRAPMIEATATDVTPPDGAKLVIEGG